MFGFRKTLDIVTVFHKAGSPASTKVVNLVKQVSANVSTGSTIDDASGTSAKDHVHREAFELNVTEDPPTSEQVQTILQYVGTKGVPSVIDGARTEQEALKRFRENRDSFLRPVVVDWNNGKAVAGSNESAILRMLDTQK